MKQRRLGVNIDHIATLRQARQVRYPDPAESLSILQECEVDQVTIHLREDRRHIQDHDLERIVQSKALPVNLEMAVTVEMLAIACKHKPKTVTFVPEKREEVTTEGGLNCCDHAQAIQEATKRLQAEGVAVSLFIDPDIRQIQVAKEIGVDAVEIHTGSYCNLLEAFYKQNSHYDYHKVPNDEISYHLNQIKESAIAAADMNLNVYAGHGLHKDNLFDVMKITDITEYNIGHAIVARAVFVGLKQAIQEIQTALSAS